MSVSIKVFPKLTKLNRIYFRLQNKTALFRKIGEDQLESTQENFEAEGRPDKWAALKPATIAAKYTKGNQGRKSKKKITTKKGTFTKGFQKFSGGDKILVDSSQLINSLLAKASRNKVELGSSGPAAKYAKFPQYGTKKMKARPFLVILPDDRVWIRKRVKEHLHKK